MCQIFLLICNEHPKRKLSKEDIHKIVTVKLQMCKICLAWILHKLTEFRKYLRATERKELKRSVYQLQNLDDRSYVNMDEIWVTFDLIYSKCETITWLR